MVTNSNQKQHNLTETRHSTGQRGDFQNITTQWRHWPRTQQFTSCFWGLHSWTRITTTIRHLPFFYYISTTHTSFQDFQMLFLCILMNCNFYSNAHTVSQQVSHSPLPGTIIQKWKHWVVSAVVKYVQVCTTACLVED